MKFNIWFCIVCVVFVQCSSTKSYVIEERDLIPEGTAFDSRTGILYIGSLYKQKIITMMPDGEIKDLISQREFGEFSPVGMEVDANRNLLWIVAASVPFAISVDNHRWITTILAFDLDSKQLINHYNMIEDPGTYFNDLTVAADGNVYVTESTGAHIYKLDFETHNISKFIELTGFNYPNGIAYSESEDCLFIATIQGLVRLDIQTKNFELLKCKKSHDIRALDGLTLLPNYFIGHQGNRVLQLYYNDQITEITAVETFDTGDEFDMSTTGDIGNGYYYYIVNSQVISGIDWKENRIKALDSLENVIIRRKKL